MPQPIDLDATICREPEPLEGDIDQETVLLSVEKGAYYQLNGVGSRVWALASTPIRVSEVVDRLVEEFDVSRSACETEVLTFVKTLCEEGLIRVTDHP
jgi:hypothetical protein